MSSLHKSVLLGGGKEPAVDGQGLTIEAQLSVSNVQQPPQICDFANLM